jgi:hypothetical protein
MSLAVSEPGNGIPEEKPKLPDVFNPVEATPILGEDPAPGVVSTKLEPLPPLEVFKANNLVVTGDGEVIVAPAAAKSPAIVVAEFPPAAVT